VKAIVRTTEVRLCTGLQDRPPSARRSRPPAELPASSERSLLGSTASAKTAVWPWRGSGLKATHVLGGRGPACTLSEPIASAHRAPSVATRRGPESYTSLPIINQAATAAAALRGRTRGLFAYNPWVLARAAAWLDRAAFKPASLPDDLVTGIALAPTVAAGLILFKFPAFQMLLIALGIGAGAQLATRWIWRHSSPRPPASPLVASVFGVALVGAGAALATSVEIVVIAVVVEVLRARFLPAIRAQAGLLAYAASRPDFDFF